jgi:hypothetical protein
MIHFIFALPMGYMFLLLATGNNNDNAMFTPEIAVAIINLFCGVCTIVVLVPLLSISGITVGKIHPFIDMTCKDVSNYSLNSSAVFIELVFSVFFSMWIGRIFSSESGINFLIARLTIINIAAFFYFINSLISATYTIRGHRFRNRLIYNFFGDN